LILFNAFQRIHETPPGLCLSVCYLSQLLDVKAPLQEIGEDRQRDKQLVVNKNQPREFPEMWYEPMTRFQRTAGLLFLFLSSVTIQNTRDVINPRTETNRLFLCNLSCPVCSITSHRNWPPCWRYSPINTMLSSIVDSLSSSGSDLASQSPKSKINPTRCFPLPTSASVSCSFSGES